MTGGDLQTVALLVTPLVTAVAARWGSMGAVKAGLRHLRGEVSQVRGEVIRAHDRIDTLYAGK